VKCGGGVRERIRQIHEHERHGGDPCGAASETASCELQACDEDCVLSLWSKISSERCSKPCGVGVKESRRHVETPAIGQGTCPEKDSKERVRFTECNKWACDGLITLSDTLVCDSSVDVVILLDGSGSLGTEGWEATKAVGMKLVEAFNHPGVLNQTNAPSMQVAVQLFSGPAYWWQYWICLYGPQYGWYPDLEAHCGIKWVTEGNAATGHFSSDTPAIVSAIEALQFPALSTFTSMALSQAKEELIYSRPEVPKVVVVVTDGWPLNWYHTGEAANRLKDLARLVWVPVTPYAPLDMLSQWASAPWEKNIVMGPDNLPLDWATLQNPEIVTEIIADICPEVK
jgi:hypothetical protein